MLRCLVIHLNNITTRLTIFFSYLKTCHFVVIKLFARKFWQGRKWQKHIFTNRLLYELFGRIFEGNYFRIIISPLLLFNKKKELKARLLLQKFLLIYCTILVGLYLISELHFLLNRVFW